MASVLGIGNALVDIIIRIENESVLDRFSLKKGSMTMIDADTSLALLEAVHQVPRQKASGGSVANTIIGLADLGISTGYIGKTGRDEAGEFFREHMESRHIRPHLMYGDSPTGRAITLVTPDGERTFGTYLGSAVEMKENELDDSIFDHYDWLMAEGYLIFNRDLIIRALEIARRKGMKVAMDMASYNLVETNLDFIRSLLANYVDLVFANELEAHALTGIEDPFSALTEIGKMCPLAVVKTGEEGSMILRDREMVNIKGIQAHCIDTTGAGDLYAAGFLYGLIRDYPLKTCGDIGSLLGGKVVEVYGAQLDAGTMQKIKEYLSEI